MTDTSGSAVVGASVTLHQLAGSSLLITASDESGHYAFQDVAGGDYLLDATAPGLSALHSVTVSIRAGETRTIPVELIVSTIRTQVSVTAASEPQAVDRVSKALDIVNVAEAEHQGLFAVSDAVRFVPGLRVATSGGPGALTTVQSRGLPPEDTAILLDGFRLRDPTSTKGDASAQIGDLLLIDAPRVEVLRGSGSSLYGTNAVSGTVNIITDPGGRAPHGDPVYGDVDVQGGGLGLFRGLLRFAGGTLSDRLMYSAGISNLTVTNGVDNGGAVRNWSAQGGLTYAFTPNIRAGATVFAKTGYVQENVSPEPTSTAPVTGIIPAIPLTPAQISLANAGQPYNPGNATFVPSLNDPDARVNSHFADSILRFEQEVNARLSYRLAYALMDSVRDNWDGPGGPGLYQPVYNTSARFTGRIGTFQGRINYLLGSHQVLTGGYEFEQEHYIELDTDQNPDPAQRAYFRTDARQRSNAVFAQDEIRLLNGRLQVLLSARFTQASLEQPVFVNAPSAYLGVQLPTPSAAYTGDASVAYFARSTSTKMRAHIGNSFRLPSLYERFGEYVFDGFAGALGDPRLSPERAVSLDAGFDQYLLHDRLKVSGTYFYARLQQVIGFLNFPPDYIDPYGRSAGYYNTGGGISRGVEVSGEFRPTTRTTVSASYTYTNAQDRTSQYYTGLPFAPLQSVRIEPNSVKVVALQQIGRRFDLAMNFEGASDFFFPLNGYAYQFNGPRQLGLAAGYTVNLSERMSARFYLHVANTLNQTYFENGFQTPPRWAIAGIHLAF
ncbi:MAG: TonB-dependent receptor [Acidobacteriaceae bacterium]|nr:TonB-dependent receptor [Acidobacteriaceae bacterium]